MPEQSIIDILSKCGLGGGAAFAGASLLVWQLRLLLNRAPAKVINLGTGVDSTQIEPIIKRLDTMESNISRLFEKMDAYAQSLARMQGFLEAFCKEKGDS